MTAIQMNAEILRNMSIIAEDEHLLKRVAKYLRKVVAEKEDPTLFTKEEFFARIDKAKEANSTKIIAALLNKSSIIQKLKLKILKLKIRRKLWIKLKK